MICFFVLRMQPHTLTFIAYKDNFYSVGYPVSLWLFMYATGRGRGGGGKGGEGIPLLYSEVYWKSLRPYMVCFLQGQPYYPPQLPPKVRAQGGYVEQAGDRVMNIQGGYPPVAVTRGAPPQVPMMGVPVEQMPALKERGVPNAALPQQAFMGYPNQDLADPNAQLDGPVPPEPPKVEPKKEEEKVGWVCVGCTFINRPRRPGCEQCGTARPVDYVIPADCPPDQDELRILQQQEENERLFHQVGGVFHQVGGAI